MLLLRGVNLGGDTKVPVEPNGGTWIKDKLYQVEAVSFVGRPFPLEEADQHLGRLRAWGFTFIRCSWDYATTTATPTTASTHDCDSAAMTASYDCSDHCSDLEPCRFLITWEAVEHAGPGRPLALPPALPLPSSLLSAYSRPPAFCPALPAYI